MTSEKFIQIAKEKGIENIQIVETIENIGQLEVVNKKLETFELSDQTQYQIKAEYNGKTVKIASDYLEEDILNLLIQKAIYTDSKYQDDYLVDKQNNNQRNSHKEIDISEKLNLLKQLDSFRNEYPEIKNLTLFYSENYEKKRIINSNGINKETDCHLYQFVPEIIIENTETTTSYDRVYLSTTEEELEIEKNLKKDILMAIKQAKKEELSTKKYDILIDGNVMQEILKNLVKMLSATNIRQKTSCLEKKLNAKIFSEKISIIEDPENKSYPGATEFDSEGIKTEKKEIVKEGILKTYLYDIKEAKELGKQSTGNGYGEISVRNMYINPGNKTFNQLLNILDDGLYITDCMGSMETAINPNTGNISLQIFGFIVKNGEIKCGFKPSIMTTTIFELLSKIEEIENKVTFTNRKVGSPCLLVKDISIAGSEKNDKQNKNSD